MRNLQPCDPDESGAIVYSADRIPSTEAVAALYHSVGWTAARKPDTLHRALLGSDFLVTAWEADRLVGVGNAISDGHMVVYFPNLVVHPDFHRRGIGAVLMRRLMERYEGFHQQVLLAHGTAVDFYRRLGFTRADGTEPMWICDTRAS